MTQNIIKYRYTFSAISDKIKKELAIVKFDVNTYLEDIEKYKKDRLSNQFYYDYDFELDFSDNPKIPFDIDERWYYYKAYHFLKLGLFLKKDAPPFKISLSHLSVEILYELNQLNGKDRKFVLKQAVGRIFEDINFDFCDDENKEKLSIDLDSIKRQLLLDQEKWFEEQEKSGINNKNYISNKLILEEELKSKIHHSDFVEYVVKAVKKTVKCEDALIRQILYTALSSFIQDDPINLGIIAPTSEGKTYPVEECIKFFPREDVYKVGSMSTKVLVRQKGILIDKTGEPIDEKIKELRKRRNLLDDRKENKGEKYEILEEMAKLFEDAKTLIDLRGKILIFLEPPQKEVWEILKPILSHDSFEIEFPFVNQTDRDGHQTKDVIVRGWPSCIFCSAKDESNWPIWPEIKSRFLITSPNMITRKYQESTKLISTTYGLPNLIQQQTIISDSEIELAKNCILLIKQNIVELRSKNKDKENKKISLWIPYAELRKRVTIKQGHRRKASEKNIFTFKNCSNNKI